jgi:hypothetical protein
MIIVYRLSWLTYALARMLVNVKYVGMVNIMAGKAVVPELIQADFTADKVVKETRNLLENRDLRDKIIRKLTALREKLGTPGAADRVANIALSMMGQGSGGRARISKNYRRLRNTLSPMSGLIRAMMACMLGYSATSGRCPLVQWMMDDVFVKKTWRCCITSTDDYRIFSSGDC